jgi:hypothetical protein
LRIAPGCAAAQGAPCNRCRQEPPLHFRRKPLVEAALKVWTAARLARAMEQLADATLQMGGGLRFANPPYELIRPTSYALPGGKVLRISEPMASPGQAEKSRDGLVEAIEFVGRMSEA